MAKILNKEAPPFPFTKPNQDTYLASAEDLGYGNGSVKDALDNAVGKTDGISKEATQSEEEAFIFETNGGTQVGKIDSTGADFTNLKRGGQQVARMSDLPTKDSSIGENPSTTNVPTTKAVKDYVDAHGGGDYPIDKESTQSENEEQVWGNDTETQEYVKIGSYGIKSKAYLDMNGNFIIEGEIGNTPSTTHAPSAKAVADYVNEHGGGVGNLPISGTTVQDDENDIQVKTPEDELVFKLNEKGLFTKALYNVNGQKCWSLIVDRLLEGNMNKRKYEVKNKLRPLKILFLGNSFAERSTRLLPQLVESAGFEIIIGVSYIGGASLDTYYYQLLENRTGTYKKYKNGTWTTVENPIMDKLFDEDWDYISLQQASEKASSYSTYNKYPDDYNLLMTNAMTIEYLNGWLMPWAWADDYLETHECAGGAQTSDAMFAQNATATQQLLTEYGNNINIFCPVGTAVQNLTTIYTQQEVFYDNGGDGLHAGRIGYFGGTCVLFEKIVKPFIEVALSDLTYSQQLISAGLPETEFVNCRTAALAAIESPFVITDLTN